MKKVLFLRKKSPYLITTDKEHNLYVKLLNLPVEPFTLSDQLSKKNNPEKLVPYRSVFHTVKSETNPIKRNTNLVLLVYGIFFCCNTVHNKNETFYFRLYGKDHPTC